MGRSYRGTHVDGVWHVGDVSPTQDALRLEIHDSDVAVLEVAEQWTLTLGESGACWGDVDRCVTWAHLRGGAPTLTRETLLAALVRAESAVFVEDAVIDSLGHLGVEGPEDLS